MSEEKLASFLREAISAFYKTKYGIRGATITKIDTQDLPDFLAEVLMRRHDTTQPDQEPR